MTLQKTHQLTYSEAEPFFASIDWEPLKQFLVVQYGIKSELDIKLKEDAYGRADISIRSREGLKDLCGIMGRTLRDVRLEVFSREFTQELCSWNAQKLREYKAAENWSFDYDDIDAVWGPKQFWGSFDLMYETLYGGRNGLKLFSASYTENEGWSFHPADEMKL